MCLVESNLLWVETLVQWEKQFQVDLAKEHFN